MHKNWYNASETQHKNTHGAAVTSAALILSFEWQLCGVVAALYDHRTPRSHFIPVINER